MYMVYADSGRNDLIVPDQTDVLKYFQLQASEELDTPIQEWVCPASEKAWRTTTVRLSGSRPPAVTNIRWLDLATTNSDATITDATSSDATSTGAESTRALVYCDIGSGMVKAHFPMRKNAPTINLATLYQPVHVEPCDLDADGNVDLIVADIGEFDANDSDLGRVVWLRKKPNGEGYTKRVIQDGLGRVADARPGDFDGDGDLDLLVAVFGWRNTGEVLLLRNEGTNAEGIPTFQREQVDKRHGPVSIVPSDINQDGLLDFVVLFGQEHESVEAFLNDGKAGFTTEVLWRAPTPAYGSSAIELVDVDGDADLDVIYSNGDTFDRGIKPHHSVQWLENQGAYPFVHHAIGKFPGAQCFCSGDFNQDGAIDIIVGNLIIGGSEAKLQSAEVPSLVLYEQTETHDFRATALEIGSYRHLAIASGDFDSDGKLDFAFGHFRRNEPAEQPDLTIRWNRSAD